MFKLTFGQRIADNKNGMKKALIALLSLFIITLWLVGTPKTALAAGEPAATASDPCEAWFLSPLECMKPALMKALTGSLNKQSGDVGTASFSMGQFVISAMGMCDAQCDPSCPRSLSYQNSALAGLQSTALAMYTHPPADTRLYIADAGKTLGFMPKVYAQGIGFAGLTPLLGLWKAFRNIAYAILAIILVVIGFMVMFRKKIDPKTVVTVQNAIPRIVVALLLVTFSYAIVGIMIDLMYLAIVLSTAVVANASPELGKVVNLWSGAATCVTDTAGNMKFAVQAPSNAPQAVTADLFNGGLWGITKFFFGSGIQSLDDIARLLTGNFSTGGLVVTTVIPGLIGGLLGGFKGAAIGLVSAPILLTLVVLIVLIFGYIRLVFMLIDAYINIIISLLTAPFQIVMEAVPGTNSFSNWFRWLLAKILVFPLTAVLLLVSAILTSQGVSETIWAPPMISTGSGGVGLSGIIGLGMLLIIPNVIANIQKSLKAEPMLPGGLAPVFGPITSGFGQLFSLAYQASFVASAVRHKPDQRSAYQVGKEGTEKGLSGIMGGGGQH